MTIKDIYQLSPLQTGIYYHWLSDSSSSLYFEQISYRLKSKDLDKELLKKSYDQLVDRHDVLRTSFRNDLAGELLQVVFNSIDSNFSFEELPIGVVGEELEKFIIDKKHTDRLKGFDLEKPGQMRLQVINLGSNTLEFIWSHHHILMDGWCMGILVKDFFHLLEANKKGVKANLPTPTPYVDYIKWLSKLDTKLSRDYWENYLLGFKNSSILPFKEAISLDKSHKVRTAQTVMIEGKDFMQLKTFCAENNITQSTFVQTVWGVLLSKYNSNQDVVFGAVVAGRPGGLAGVEDMIGLFINTIPVRVKYKASHDTPLGLLKKLQKEAILGTNHHYQNLADIQSIGEKGASLIDHILVFENYPVEKMVEPDSKDKLEMSVETYDFFEQNNYDFSISAVPHVDALEVTFKYDQSLYDPELMTNMGCHYENMVKDFLNQPDLPLSEISLLKREEQNLILKRLNDTEMDFELNDNLVKRFTNFAIEQPEKTALVFESESYTYRQLDKLTNQMSNWLKEKFNVESGHHVAIFLERNEWQLISLLSILKSGACYIPIDINTPAKRKDSILKESSCTLCLDVEKLNDFRETSDDFSIVRSNKNINSSDLAYIMYTSVISHRNLTNYYFAIEERLKISQCNSFGLVTEVSTDLGNTVLFGAWMSGGALHVLNKDTLTDGLLLQSYIQKNKLDCMKIVPSHWSALTESSILPLPRKMLIFGGDVLSGNVIDKILSHSDDLQIVNHYGPTETTIGCIVNLLSKREENISIGKPLANTQVYIVNDIGQIQPVGIPGEVCVSGIGVSLGYHNDPITTSQKFINHPFIIGEKLYKTGDLGKLNMEGTIEFLGRRLSNRANGN